MKFEFLKRSTVALLGASMILTPAIALAEDAPAKTPPAATPPATTPPATTKPDEAGPQKFYGPVTAVDTAAKTFTVGDQTFNIVGESQLTKAADDSAATIADAVVGQPARGTYTKSADGKLNVTKVRFGRKTGGKAGGKSSGKKKGDAAAAPDAPAPK